MQTNDQKENQSDAEAQQPQAGSLNTMQSDYSRAIQDNDRTLASVALEAQARKRRAQYGTDKNIIRVAEKSHTRIVLIVIFLFFAILLSIIGYKLLFAEKSAPDPFAQFAVSVPIIPNTQIGVHTFRFHGGFEKVLSEIAINSAVTENEITHIYFTDEKVRRARSISEQNPVEITSILNILTLMSQDIPESLLRTVDERNYIYGIYGLPNNERSQFLLLKNSDYKNAFAGMLDWEDTMVQDLSILLQIEPEENAVYKDKLFFNNDIRIVENSLGETMLLYSFIDTNTIIITKSTDAFKNLLTLYYQSQ